jgi:hypothetical protein
MYIHRDEKLLIEIYLTFLYYIYQTLLNICFILNHALTKLIDFVYFCKNSFDNIIFIRNENFCVELDN